MSLSFDDKPGYTKHSEGEMFLPGGQHECLRHRD